MYIDVTGVDKGTTYTKTDNYKIIRSTIRKYKDNEINIDKEKIIIEYQGEKYVIGEKGQYSTDLMKSEHKNSKLLILTALGLSTDDYLETNLVTNLPIGLFSKQKDKMKSMFNKIENIIINNVPKQIVLRNVEVFPEAAGAFYSQTEYDSGLVIDIGGLSVDTALFENNKLIQYSTYSMGIMKLYSKIANMLNSEYDLSLTEWDIEDVLKDGLYIYGEKQKLNINDLIHEHTQEILQRIKLEYDLKKIPNIINAGGGSRILNFNFPNSKELDIFANAIGNKNIGKVLFAA